MSEFLSSRWGGAIVGAVGLVVGVFLSSLLGLSEASPSAYLSGAAAGFIGGYVGVILRERRSATGDPDEDPDG